MITEIQSQFIRDGSYANQFDELGNLVIINSTEKYLAVTLTPEVYEITSVANVYTIGPEEFKDVPRTDDPKLVALKSEKTTLQNKITTLTSELSKMSNSSGKDALISASKDTIVGLRIKSGEGKIPSDFNTVFPYLPLKSSDAVQSDASSTGLGSGTANNSTTVTNNNSTQSTALVGAQTGLVPSPQQCVRQQDIQLSPPLEFATYLPPAPSATSAPAVGAAQSPSPVLAPVPPAQKLSIIQTAKVVATTPVSSITAFKLIEEQSVKCGGRVENKSFASGRYVVRVDFGTLMGEVTFQSNAFQVPDRMIVEWDNNVVVDTGYRGETIYQEGLTKSLKSSGLPIESIKTGGKSTFTFEKTKETPSVATVTILAPLSGTAWEFSVGCPNPQKISISNIVTTQSIQPTIMTAQSVQPTIMTAQSVQPNEDCVNPQSIFKFTGNVDHTLRITLRGTNVTYSNEQYRGTLSRTVSEFVNNGVGPYNTNLTIKWNGRGSVQISQQPNSSNNYTAIIDIFDGKGAEGTYNVEVFQLKCSQQLKTNSGGGSNPDARWNASNRHGSIQSNKSYGASGNVQINNLSL